MTCYNMLLQGEGGRAHDLPRGLTPMGGCAEEYDDEKLERKELQEEDEEDDEGAGDAA